MSMWTLSLCLGANLKQAHQERGRRRAEPGAQAGVGRWSCMTSLTERSGHILPDALLPSTFRFRESETCLASPGKSIGLLTQNPIN